MKPNWPSAAQKSHDWKWNLSAFYCYSRIRWFFLFWNRTLKIEDTRPSTSSSYIYHVHWPRGSIERAFIRGENTKGVGDLALALSNPLKVFPENWKMTRVKEFLYFNTCQSPHPHSRSKRRWRTPISRLELLSFFKSAIFLKVLWRVQAPVEKRVVHVQSRINYT